MDPLKNILVVDDEEMLRDAVSSYLMKKGFRVFPAGSGAQALQIFETQTISFVILDLMLPDISGEEVCARICRQSRVPIIMLTAKTAENDILNGLHIGADDYMTKPFSLKELYARMEVITRRAADDLKPLASMLCWNDGDLEVHFEQRTIKKQGNPVMLTPIEWKILSALIKYPQKIFTRDDLLSIAFDTDFNGYDRVVDTHIKNLRKKIEDDPKKPVYLCTIRGVGYKFGGDDL